MHAPHRLEAELVLARRLVGGGGEVLVATAAAATAGDDDGFIGVSEIVKQLAGLFVIDEGADGDPQGGGLAGEAGAVGSETVATALRLMLRVEAEVDERVVAEGGRHEDVAAVAAISAGGATARDELLPAEGHAAVAAVAGFDTYFCFVEEHKDLFQVYRPAPTGCGRATTTKPLRGGDETRLRS